jgi:hypothetical protein
VDDGISDGNTEQDYNDNVADTTHNATTANIVARKRREKAPRMRGTRHRLPTMVVQRFGRCLKPGGSDKVAYSSTDSQKKTAGRA